jgi:hypothetical protein
MGCGALGSLIVTMLNVDNTSYLFWDDDRVDADNIGTSAFLQENIGAFKVRVLANYVYRKNRTSAQTHYDTFGEEHVGRLFSYTDRNVVLDCFDNSDARNLLHRINRANILHIGVNQDLIGNIEWDEIWEPLSPIARGENPVCTHHLGSKILLSTSFHAVCIIHQFIETGSKINRIVNQYGATLVEY